MTKQFLEITDLPSDENNVFHGLRIPLIKVFNACREQEYKMTAFKHLLKFMYNTVLSYEKVRDASKVTKPIDTKTTE